MSPSRCANIASLHESAFRYMQAVDIIDITQRVAVLETRIDYVRMRYNQSRSVATSGLIITAILVLMRINSLTQTAKTVVQRLVSHSYIFLHPIDSPAVRKLIVITT